MNDKFDQLAKDLARCVTRRVALKKFGAGLVGVALASLGLVNKASAAPAPGGPGDHCSDSKPCSAGLFCCPKSRRHLNIRYCSLTIDPCVFG